jgi:hypothetical protein
LKHRLPDYNDYKEDNEYDEDYGNELELNYYKHIKSAKKIIIENVSGTDDNLYIIKDIAYNNTWCCKNI